MKSNGTPMNLLIGLRTKNKCVGLWKINAKNGKKGNRNIEEWGSTIMQNLFSRKFVEKTYD